MTLSTRRLGWVIAAAFIAVPTMLAISVPSNPDTSWLLHVAGSVLDGARLGVDVVEVNAPLIVWIDMPIVALARLTGLDSWLMFHALLGLLLAASTALCTALVPAPHPGAGRALTPVVFALVLAVLPTSEWGQREHLAVAAVLPYLLLAARRIERVPAHSSAAAAVGVLAGVGFCLKPFFLLPLGLVIGLQLWRVGKSSIRYPELTAIACVLLGYLIAVPVAAPDFLQMARTWWPVYRSFEVLPASSLLPFMGSRPWIVAFLALLAALVARRRMPAWSLEATLALAALGFLAGAVIQWKPWSYNWLPAAMLGWTGLWLAALRPAISGDRALAWGRAVLVLIGIAFAAGYLLRCAWWARSLGVMDQRAGRLARVLECLDANDSFAAFSLSHGLGFPLANRLEAQWGLRIQSLWMVAALRRDTMSRTGLADAGPPSSDRETQVLGWISEDMWRTQPAVILDHFSLSDSLAGRTSLVRWLGRNGLDDLLQLYSPVTRVGDAVVYAPASVRDRCGWTAITSRRGQIEAETGPAVVVSHQQPSRSPLHR